MGQPKTNPVYNGESDYTASYLPKPNTGASYYGTYLPGFNVQSLLPNSNWINQQPIRTTDYRQRGDNYNWITQSGPSRNNNNNGRQDQPLSYFLPGTGSSSPFMTVNVVSLPNGGFGASHPGHGMNGDKCNEGSKDSSSNLKKNN